MNIVNIPKQIIKGKLTPLNLDEVDSIVLHHMAHSTADVKTVEGWHINKGWSAIGYNYFVAFDGTVYEGRGLNVSASVSGHNDHIISIGFQGDYDITSSIMPRTQYLAGEELIKYLLNIFPKAIIKGHKDFGGTVCPGKNFPLSKFKKLRCEEKMTVNEAINIVKSTAHLSSNTIDYLMYYKYGDELMLKLAKAIKGE